MTPSSSYLELPNSTWPFSSKVHEITKFRISWSNSWKKLRFDQVRFAKIFKSWLIAKNEHRLGRFACSIKLLEVPNRGPWAKSLSLSDYSGLFWSEKSKLMKYKYVFIKCCSTISLLKSKYFGPHSYLKFNIKKVMSTIGVSTFAVTCEKLTTYWRRHFMCSL